MATKPTLVFVPGAWHTTEYYSKVTTLLETQQYNSIRVTLPSVSSDRSKTFLDDVNAVRAAIVSETTQGHDVVVIAHSYGGLPGASAIKGLARTKDDAGKTSGHVIGIILIASGFIPTGICFLQAIGGVPPPLWKADSETGLAVLSFDARESFYHDLPVEEGEYWVSKLEQQSLSALAEGGEHVYAGWQDVPAWYLATSEDRGLPIQAQRAMAQGLIDSGKEVTLKEIESSHSPMLSKPKETADLIAEAAASFV